MNPLRRRSDWPRRAWRRLFSSTAIRGYVALAALLGCIAAAVAVDHTLADHALTRATRANEKATHALSSAEGTIVRLQDEATGLCSAISSDRTYVDQAHHVLHGLLLFTAALESQQARSFARGISRGVHRAGRLEHALSSVSLAGASEIKDLAPLDCRQLTSDPLGYREPTPQPFTP